MPGDTHGPDRGHAAIAGFFRNRAEVRGAPLELLPTRANGQPAFGCYLKPRAWGMLVMSVSGPQVTEIAFFSDASLVARFGLPHRNRPAP